MEPIKARFAGMCVRTGQPYKQGDLIVKTKKGWALAQTRGGKIKIAPDWRLCRLPDGIETQINLNNSISCRVCLQASGKDLKDLSESERGALLMDRQAGVLVCPKCGRRIEIIPEAELNRRKAVEEAEREAAYQRDMEANLHLEHVANGFYSLSHRLGPERWPLVSQYFRYWSHDDLDQMDYFDMPGGWYVQSWPVTTTEPLNGAPPSDLTVCERIEQILNIRPENTLAAQAVRAEAARIAMIAQERAEREFQKRFDAAFDYRQGEKIWGEDLGLTEGVSLNSTRIPIRLQGEAVNIGDGQNIYGGGEWLVLDADGAHVWHVRNNGMDGDDWSRNNVITGGAGAIGIMFELTPERSALVKELKQRQEERN